MPFALEALAAKHGDALLLHYGPDDASEIVLIDGGPPGVYRKTLRARLGELRSARQTEGRIGPDDPLPIPLVMVSHIDQDHIAGVLDLTNELVKQAEARERRSVEIGTLWHNSFDDLVGKAGSQALAAALGAGGALAASVEAASADLPITGPLARHSAAVAASVGEGRRLRNNAETLALAVNDPFGGLVTRTRDEAPEVSLGGGLVLTVLGPDQARIDALQQAWDAKLREMGVGKEAEALAAAYEDNSPFNLSSIVVLAEQDGATMLLTGDARGDDILAGLQAAGRLEDGHLHVGLLKVPHHGSDRNVSTDFFRAVTADHYVFSGDGKHHNPELATLDMLIAARGEDAYTMHFTYAEHRVRKHLDRVKESRHAFEVRERGEGKSSFTVEVAP